MAAATEPDQTTDSSEATLDWRVWLLTAHPARGGLAVAVCALTVWFTHSLSGSAFLAGFAAFVLLASLSHFFLPTTFHLDTEAVRISNPLYRRRRLWREFRGYARAGARLKLLTLPPGSRLDNYRGMLLLLPPGEPGEAAVRFVRARLEAPADLRAHDDRG